MVRFSFCGAELELLPSGALYWPARAALLVADLHFEKASWYAGGGQMLPPYDSIATLTDLTAAVTATRAREIWCLGDSFHDRSGCERLPQQAQAMLRALTSSTDWTWISGNHDMAARDIADHCGGRVLEEIAIDGLILRHEAKRGEPNPELSGHYHPKLRLRLRGRQVARRCFVTGRNKLILPAFGTLTGGLDAYDPAIRRLVGASATALVPLADRLLRFPLAA